MKDTEYQPVAHKNGQEPKAVYPSKGWGKRHTQTLLVFMTAFVGILLRAHLSVSIVAMISHKHDVTQDLNDTTDINVFRNNTSIYYDTTEDIANAVNGTEIESQTTTEITVCEKDVANDYNETKSETKWGIVMTYDWNKATQVIVFSFFVSYTATMIPVGIVVQRIGWKVPLCVAMLANGILSGISPWIVMFVSLPLGSTIGLQVAGFLSSSSYFGWPASFWFCGILSLICFGLLSAFGVDSPCEHPTISEEEFLYITGSTSSDIVPKSNASKWQVVLVILFAIQVVPNGAFVVFGCAEVQPWNYYDGDKPYDADPVNEELYLKTKK